MPALTPRTPLHTPPGPTRDPGATAPAPAARCPATEFSARDRRLGFVTALGVFVVWGLIPIYWKWLGGLPALELLCHRVVWSTLFVGVLLTARRGWAEFRRSVSPWRTRGLLAASGATIGVNWAFFIWAVNAGKILETSLAYFMNPLINVLIGFAVFGERLRRLQVAALVFAAAGVANLALTHGSPPWLALVLATTFGLYAALRKAARVAALPGLFFETALLAPLALAYLFAHGAVARVFTEAPGRGALLAASGVVTSLPLAAFAFGVRRLRLSTVGLLQYIAPSITFGLGVFVYHEPFSRAQLVTFVLIWLGVAAYSAEAVWFARRPGLQAYRADCPPGRGTLG